jgi:hypothetical protein
MIAGRGKFKAASRCQRQMVVAVTPTYLAKAVLRTQRAGTLSWFCCVMMACAPYANANRIAVPTDSAAACMQQLSGYLSAALNHQQNRREHKKAAPV